MNVFILGHLGNFQNPCDGQTIKTVSLYYALKESRMLGISCVDTYQIKISKTSFLLTLLKQMLVTKNCIVMLSKKGRFFLFPLLWIYITFLNGRVFHYVVGGRLEDEYLNSPIIRFTIKKFERNWVESQSQALALKNMGLINAEYLPNFKLIPILKKEDLVFQSPNSEFKFCTFSRVVKEKGILDAIEAIEELRQKGVECCLDIYGPIDKTFQEEFRNVLRSSGTWVKYKGIVPANKSVDVIKSYFMLLFPTTWSGEGMPGSIIDAYCAGVPVIARRWRHSEEIIENDVTGFLYKDSEELSALMLYAVNHIHHINEMKYRCITKANDFNKDRVISKIVNDITS